MTWLIQIKLATLFCLAICVGCDGHHSSKHEDQLDPGQPGQPTGEVGKQPIEQKKVDPGQQQPPSDGPKPGGIPPKPTEAMDEVCVTLGRATLSDLAAAQVSNLRKGSGSRTSLQVSFRIEDSAGPTRTVDCYSDLNP